MDGRIDVTTVLFLVLAVVIFLKLRSVLGRRTGHEQTRYERLKAQQEAAQRNGKLAAQEKVVTLPRRDRDEAEPRAAEGKPRADVEERVKGLAGENTSVARALVDIIRADLNFDPDEFLKGARAAYEIIVTAFAEGNRKLLKTLLNRDVFDGFMSAVGERETRGETVSTSFVGINRADIIDAELKNRTARVTVKIVSQLITAIRNRNGEVIDGDPKQIREVTDIWTFAREVSSKDPNWKLVATQAAN